MKTKTYFAELEEEKELISKLLLQVNDVLSRAPEGRLRIRKCRSCYQFRIYYPKINKADAYEKYMSKKNTDDLKKYAAKYYLERLKKSLESEHACIQSGRVFDWSEKEKIYDDLPDCIKQYVYPLCASVNYKIDRWYNSTFQSNSYEIDSAALLQTDSGEYVRSRAECLIANALYKNGLKYHYEEKLVLANKKTVYPDFTIAHPRTGELYYLEFFGMMDNLEYSKKAFSKLNEYSMDPVFPRMIYIFDSAGVPFSTAALQNIVDTIFLDRNIMV